MASNKLQIVIHHARGLRDVKHFRRMNPYVVVRIEGNCSVSEQKTPTAEKGDCNPTWECSMLFDIISMRTDYILVFEIMHDGTMFDQRIGEVQVRFANLLAVGAPRHKVRYQVVIPSGEKEGEITVSHHFSNLVAGSNMYNVSNSYPNNGSGSSANVSENLAYTTVEGMVSGVAGGVTQTVLEKALPSEDKDEDEDDEDEDEDEDEEEDEGDDDF